MKHNGLGALEVQAAAGSVYAVAGSIAMLAIAVRWRDDRRPAHAPAKAG